MHTAKHAFFALALVLFLQGSAAAQVRHRAIHGASDAQYQTFINQVEKEGLRPIWIHVGGPADAPVFAAVAIDDGTATPWAARHHQTADAWQKEFNTWTGKGYRLLCQCGYARGGTTNFAGIFAKQAGTPLFEARFGQTSAEYQKTFDALSKKSFRLSQLNGYPVGKGYRLACVFVDDEIKDWRGFHDQTAAQYQKGFDDLIPQGYRAVAIAAYPTGAGTRFGSSFVKGGPNVEWVARSNLTSDQYQKEYETWTAKGFVPMQVVSYPDAGGLHYAVLFEKPGKALVAVKYPLPMSGSEVAGLGAFDDAMQKFMKERHLSGGTLAVMKDGKMLLSRGYGYRDAAASKLMGPQEPLRIASISKPITLAALMRLIMQGHLSTKTKVVEYLGIAPPAGKTMDKRWNDITIGELIEHKGGFDRDKSGDPMFMSTKIAAALGKKGPAEPKDIITYMAGQPLDFAPGTKSAYSNFGYCILGRVIEKATSKSYIEHMKTEFFKPMGLKTMDLGHSLPKDRSPAEPVYLDPHSGLNIITGKGTVPAPDGTFYLEAMDAHGGLITSAPDLVHFFSAFWMDGSARKGNGLGYSFFGSLPGTWTCAIQRPDGYVIAALFNQREDSSGLKYDAIRDMLNQAAENVK